MPHIIREILATQIFFTTKATFSIVFYDYKLVSEEELTKYEVDENAQDKSITVTLT